LMWLVANFRAELGLSQSCTEKLWVGIREHQ